MCVRWVRLTSCQTLIRLVAMAARLPSTPHIPASSPTWLLSSWTLRLPSVSNHLPFKPSNGPFLANWPHLPVIFSIRQRRWFRIRSAICFPSDANHLFVVKVLVLRTVHVRRHCAAVFGGEIKQRNDLDHDGDCLSWTDSNLTTW